MAKKAHLLSDEELREAFDTWERRQRDQKIPIAKWLLFWLIWALVFIAWFYQAMVGL